MAVYKDLIMFSYLEIECLMVSSMPDDSLLSGAILEYSEWASLLGNHFGGPLPLGTSYYQWDCCTLGTYLCQTQTLVCKDTKADVDKW